MKSKAQLKMDLRNNQARAEQWHKAVRQQMNKMLNVGSRHTLPGGNPNGTGPGLTQGVTPNDAEVQEYIRSLGGNPYIAKMQAAQQGLRNLKDYNKTGSSGVAKQAAKQVNKTFGALSKKNKSTKSKASVPEGESDLQKFLADAQSQYDAANKANEERYADILGRLEGSRDRNLERVENYGVAAGADLEERAAETLGNIKARLSARGLGNSTIFSAFEQRNARDLANEQQRLSERVDSRTADYDQRLTADIASFMERRNDVGPDYNQIANIAQQYGLSGDGQGYQAPEEVASSGYQGPGGSASVVEKPQVAQAEMVAPPQVPQPTVPQYRRQQPVGVSPQAAMMIARNTQAQMPNYGNGFQMAGIGWSSPSYAPPRQRASGGSKSRRGDGYTPYQKEITLKQLYANRAAG